MVGVYLLLSTINDIHGHVLMNLSRVFHIRKLSFKARSVVHFLSLSYYAYDTGNPNIRQAEYKDFLTGFSCVVAAMVETPPDIFSLCMIFSSPVALSTFIIHALEMNWYKFYKNNHFKIVKNTSYYLYPLLIVLLAYGVNVLSYAPFVSSRA